MMDDITETYLLDFAMEGGSVVVDLVQHGQLVINE